MRVWSFPRSPGCWLATRRRRDGCFRSANGRVFAIGLVVAGATFVFAPALAAALTPGAVEEERALLARLLQLSAPLQLLWIAVLTAVSLANARGRFVVAALSTVVPSIPVIVLLAAPDRLLNARCLAIPGERHCNWLSCSTVLRPHWPDYSPRLSLATRTGISICRYIGGRRVSAVQLDRASRARTLVTCGHGRCCHLRLRNPAHRRRGASIALGGARRGRRRRGAPMPHHRQVRGCRFPVAFRSAIVLVAMSAGALVALGTDFADFLLEGGQFSAADAILLGSGPGVDRARHGCAHAAHARGACAPCPWTPAGVEHVRLGRTPRLRWRCSRPPRSSIDRRRHQLLGGLDSGGYCVDRASRTRSGGPSGAATRGPPFVTRGDRDGSSSGFVHSKSGHRRQ